MNPFHMHDASTLPNDNQQPQTPNPERETRLSLSSNVVEDSQNGTYLATPPPSSPQLYHPTPISLQSTQAVRHLLQNAEAAAEIPSPTPTTRGSKSGSSAPIDYAALAALFPKRSPGLVHGPARRSKARIEPYPSNVSARQDCSAQARSSRATTTSSYEHHTAETGGGIDYAYLSLLLGRPAAVKSAHHRAHAEPAFVPDPNASEADNVINIILNPPVSAFKTKLISVGGAKILPRHWLYRMSKQNFIGSGRLRKDSVLQDFQAGSMGMSEQYLEWLKGKDWSEASVNPTLEEYRDGAFRAQE
ncbi:hypothetical protein LTS18_008614 [Coniosporium uncinatum]|uniref:Uncharacterized protein n=1 Tax=Coniosporium uncinatum TaxID=93489 RepID=A0ACC3DAQ6_9PEZI|nr:hypothetical protein LTS18_008614 [Coniosporium uncinatum]